MDKTYLRHRFVPQEERLAVSARLNTDRTAVALSTASQGSAYGIPRTGML